MVWFRIRYSDGLLHKYGKGALGSIQRGVLDIPDDKDANFMEFGGSAGPFITTAVRVQTTLIALPIKSDDQSVTVHLVLQTYRWLCLGCSDSHSSIVESRNLTKRFLPVYWSYCSNRQHQYFGPTRNTSILRPSSLRLSRSALASFANILSQACKPARTMPISSC